MGPQNFEKKRVELIKAFRAKMAGQAKKPDPIKLSWSNWGFGMETLERTAARLRKNGIEWIE